MSYPYGASSLYAAIALSLINRRESNFYNKDVKQALIADISSNESSFLRDFTEADRRKPPHNNLRSYRNAIDETFKALWLQGLVKCFVFQSTLGTSEEVEAVLCTYLECLNNRVDRADHEKAEVFKRLNVRLAHFWCCLEAALAEHGYKASDVD